MAMGEIGWLPKSTLDRIEQAIDEIKRAMGDHVEAIVLVGAAVHPERHDRARMPELLVVASEASVDDLHGLADMLRTSMKQGLRLRVLTRVELERSADVFTVEIAEYKAHHVVLAGSDPFEDVSWSDADMRRSVEQGLRGIGRRARNRVLSGVATDGRRDDPQAAVAQALERLLLLGRHALPLLGEKVPELDGAVIDALAAKVGVDSTLHHTLSRVRVGQRVADPLAAVADLLALVEPLTARIDQLRSAG